jgi:hypothetical protein
MGAAVAALTCDSSTDELPTCDLEPTIAAEASQLAEPLAKKLSIVVTVTKCIGVPVAITDAAAIAVAITLSITDDVAIAITLSIPDDVTIAITLSVTENAAIGEGRSTDHDILIAIAITPVKGSSSLINNTVKGDA